jgi:hypothetical protein
MTVALAGTNAIPDERIKELTTAIKYRTEAKKAYTKILVFFNL